MGIGVLHSGFGCMPRSCPHFSSRRRRREACARAECDTDGRSGFYGEWSEPASEELAKVPTMLADAQVATAAGGRVNMGETPITSSECRY